MKTYYNRGLEGIFQNRDESIPETGENPEIPKKKTKQRSYKSILHVSQKQQQSRDAAC